MIFGVPQVRRVDIIYKEIQACHKLPEMIGGRKTAQEKKNKFLGTEVPRNFSDQCSLDFAYFLGPKVPRNFVPGNFFSYFRWVFLLQK